VAVYVYKHFSGSELSGPGHSGFRILFVFFEKDIYYILKNALYFDSVACKVMRRIIPKISILILILAGSLYAGQSQNEPRQLEKIREEIEGFKVQLTENDAKEKTLLQNVLELDYEIDLREKLYNELLKSERNIAGDLKANNKKHDNLNAEIDVLRSRFKKRAIELYKHGRPKLFEFLVNSKSLNKTLALRKYYQALLRKDEKSIEVLSDKSEQSGLLNILLSDNLEKQRSLVRDAQKEAGILKNKKAEREKLIYSLRDDTNRMKLTIAEYRRAEKILTDEIANLRENETNEGTHITFEGFALFSSTKGSLPFPVSGLVISHVGLAKDPVTKVETENRGVEILSNYGADVRVVWDGRIAKIKWLPWYGQTVFVQHTEGYYTVYARLTDISVKPDDPVATDQVIGKVGLESSSNQAKLQFQIWKGAETLDPEDWLAADNSNDSRKTVVEKNRVKN